MGPPGISLPPGVSRARRRARDGLPRTQSRSVCAPAFGRCSAVASQGSPAGAVFHAVPSAGAAACLLA
eukprot:7536504-Alexandrium_andersonii.AAC.1